MLMFTRGFLGFDNHSHLQAGPAHQALMAESQKSELQQFRQAACPAWNLEEGLWVDEIHFAPPKKPWNDDSPVSTSKQWFPMVSKWCRSSSTQSMFLESRQQRRYMKQKQERMSFLRAPASFQVPCLPFGRLSGGCPCGFFLHCYTRHQETQTPGSVLKVVSSGQMPQLNHQRHVCESPFPGL